MKIAIQVYFKQVVDSLTDDALRQVPFAVSKTINAIGQGVRDKLKAQLPVAFDRPTPFTQRGVFMKAATKAVPVAMVFFPESQENQGRAQREYIRPGTNGATARQQKKTEYLLTRMGYLPAGWVSVPGRYMATRLDGYGNMSGSYYKQIIRGLGIKNSKGPPKPVSKASAVRVARMGVDAEFFAVYPGSNRLGKGGGYLPSGVYRRTGAGGRTLVQYLKFVKKAAYKQRLDVRKESLLVVKQIGQRSFDETVQLITSKYRVR